ncbi:PREDICTED: myeloid leukemia factor isoform X2 [Dinoponera quadriceps]|uniref:Myeloid leukemia factor isoform X2 n=1 Tax=Dinoponera quadriceps TaxID=609295 RepID=A0A6P3XS06_DINQU|nr:PREDICTED: myeloid leukemia factor isoform X2 [Dinoponera quadriceps]
MNVWTGWPNSVFDEIDQLMPQFGFPFARGMLEPLHHPMMQPRMGAMQPLFFRDMMNFDFPVSTMSNISNLSNMSNMGNNSHSFMRQSVVSMSSGPDGRPQIYEETMSTTTAPGGIKETKKTVRDSRTGTKKMAIGHHIGDRAHILEREHNMRSGESEERQEFINLDEDEAESFNREWETRTRSAASVSAIGRSSSPNVNRNRADVRQLALPSTSEPSTREATTETAESPKRKGKGKGKSSSTEVPPSTPESRKREASEEPSVVYIPSKKAK